MQTSSINNKKRDGERECPLNCPLLKHTDTLTHTQTHRHTYTHTHIHRHTYTHKHAYTHICTCLFCLVGPSIYLFFCSLSLSLVSKLEAGVFGNARPDILTCVCLPAWVCVRGGGGQWAAAARRVGGQLSGVGSRAHAHTQVGTWGR